MAYRKYLGSGYIESASLYGPSNDRVYEISRRGSKRVKRNEWFIPSSQLSKMEVVDVAYQCVGTYGGVITAKVYRPFMEGSIEPFVEFNADVDGPFRKLTPKVLTERQKARSNNSCIVGKTLTAKGYDPANYKIPEPTESIVLTDLPLGLFYGSDLSCFEEVRLARLDKVEYARPGMVLVKGPSIDRLRAEPFDPDSFSQIGEVISAEEPDNDGDVEISAARCYLPFRRRLEPSHMNLSIHSDWLFKEMDAGESIYAVVPIKTVTFSEFKKRAKEKEKAPVPDPENELWHRIGGEDFLFIDENGNKFRAWENRADNEAAKVGRLKEGDLVSWCTWNSKADGNDWYVFKVTDMDKFQGVLLGNWKLWPALQEVVHQGHQAAEELVHY